MDSFRKLWLIKRTRMVLIIIDGDWHVSYRRFPFPFRSFFSILISHTFLCFVQIYLPFREGKKPLIKCLQICGKMRKYAYNKRLRRTVSISLCCWLFFFCIFFLHFYFFPRWMLCNRYYSHAFQHKAFQWRSPTE